MKKKTFYLLSIIDLDTQETNPLAIFDSKKELKNGIKRWENNINNKQGNYWKLIKNEDYEITKFYLNNFY